MIHFNSFHAKTEQQFAVSKCCGGGGDKWGRRFSSKRKEVVFSDCHIRYAFIECDTQTAPSLAENI